MDHESLLSIWWAELPIERESSLAPPVSGRSRREELRDAEIQAQILELRDDGGVGGQAACRCPKDHQLARFYGGYCSGATWHNDQVHRAAVSDLELRKPASPAALAQHIVM